MNMYDYTLKLERIATAARILIHVRRNLFLDDEAMRLANRELREAVEALDNYVGLPAFDSEAALNELISRV